MTTKSAWVVDIEANGLQDANKIWCIVCEDIVSGKVVKFRPNSPTSGHEDFKEDFIRFVHEYVDWFIGHNFLNYDLPTINRLIQPGLINPLQVTDTLVLSRLLRPTMNFAPSCWYKNDWNNEEEKAVQVDNRQGGHSLRAWGVRLGDNKLDWTDWSQFSEPMLTYCVQDVHLNRKIYETLCKEQDTYNFGQEALALEHKVSWMLGEQERNGFTLDIPKAERLKEVTKTYLESMGAELRELFPALWIPDRILTMKVTKSGEINKVSQKTLEKYQTTPGLKAEPLPDGTYQLFEQEIFNPDSGQQVAKRLLTLGWVPKYFTEKGAPKTDRDSIGEAVQGLLNDNPSLVALKVLADYGIVSDRHNRVQKWLALSAADGKIHGQVNPMGTWTSRCSHSNDNMANVPSVMTDKEKWDESKHGQLKKFELYDGHKRFLKREGEKVEFALEGLPGLFGWDCRDVWIASNADLCIIGVDASGIQLRALAHYMRDPEYIEVILHGDVHEKNRLAAGIKDRATAKTFIYAWLLGAGDEKIGTIVGITPEEIVPLIKWAMARKIWKGTLLSKIQTKLVEQGRNPKDKKTIATIIKGFKTKEEFLEKTPALKRLKEKDIPAVAKQRYFIGLDGRKIWVESAHLAMGAYLQGFEAVIMKKAMELYQTKLKELGIYFKQLAFVHDEFQIEGRKEDAETIGKTVVWAIQEAGRIFGSLCPLDGAYRYGNSWAESH